MNVNLLKSYLDIKMGNSQSHGDSSLFVINEEQLLNALCEEAERNRLKADNEKLRTELIALRNRVDSMNDAVTSIFNHYNTDREGQIEVLKIFFQLHCRTAPGSRITAKDLNDKVYKFSCEKGIPIKKTEVKELVTGAPFNFVQYKSTNGIACYRDLEFIPVNLNVMDMASAKDNKRQTPMMPALSSVEIKPPVLSPQATPMKVRNDTMSPVGSPAPVMVNRA